MKMTPCGHEQETPCNDPAIRQNCNAPVKSYSKGKCGHFSMVPCRLVGTLSVEESRKYCLEPCKHIFAPEDGGCGHRCKGTCSECMESLIHKKCGEQCGKALV